MKKLQLRHCQVPGCAACEALDAYGVQEPRDESIFPTPETPRECLLAVREQLSGSLAQQGLLGRVDAVLVGVRS